MRLLVAAATVFELDLLQQYLEREFEKTNEGVYAKGKLEICVCITGIGMLQTAFNLTESIHHFNPHFCLQAGIAGTFNKELELGQLVIVQSEILGDTGVEDKDRFLDIFDIGLIHVSDKPFSNKQLINTFQDFPLKLNLPFVTGLTVNTVSGHEETIKKRAEHYECDIESMEGAAFHYVCLKKKIPFLQVRSISNHVEPRDKSKWKMKEAIEKLNYWIIENIPQ